MKLAFWLLLIAAIVLTVVGAMPLVIAGVAEAIASTHSCLLDEGNVHPCVINGSDWGDTLYTMFGVGWMSLLTIWLLLLAVPVWCGWIVVLVLRIVRRGDRNAAARAATGALN